MMKTTLPYRGICRFLFIMLGASLMISSAHSQSFKGKEGDISYNSSGIHILNRYSALASTATAGSLSITVADISELAGSYSFPGAANPYTTDAIAQGDLVMIIQMQGADIITTDDASYGTITEYNGAGNYEFRTVFNVSGNTILLCENLSNTYTQSGRSRSQVVRVPRFNNFLVGNAATITGKGWDGLSGGIVAVEANGTVTVDGLISANGLGFRGGVDDRNNSSASGGAAVTLYRTTVTTTTATKGEGIAGNASDYNTYLNGANGRGAPANGGGGGNGHNAGGGGGANAARFGSLLPWNGTGIKNTSGTGWATAWNFESANFATDTSVGGGRGGYSFSNSNQDALVLGPGNSSWGGDRRQIVGGLGGRPLDYSGSTLLFLGGGGGAGDGNNNASGNGGNGGGIVFILANTQVDGTGTITANGQNGHNTTGSNIDAAGGGGGGGAVVVLSNIGISNISVTANGGKGGDQLTLSGEAEGPGGGGGGGYIASSHTGFSRTANGGTNGISHSAHITEFTPNGATIGASGTIASRTYFNVQSCDPIGFVLPIQLISFQAIQQPDATLLKWVSQEEINFSHFELEMSTDGHTFHTIALIFAKENPGATQTYQYKDQSAPSRTISYYRLKMIDKDGQFRYSQTRIVRWDNSVAISSLRIFPNPATNTARVSLPAEWQNKAVQFEIIDLSGKTIQRQQLDNSNAVENIGIHSLAKGIYIVRIRCGDITIQGRIVKN